MKHKTKHNSAMTKKEQRAMIREEREILKETGIHAIECLATAAREIARALNDECIDDNGAIFCREFTQKFSEIQERLQLDMAMLSLRW